MNNYIERDIKFNEKWYHFKEPTICPICKHAIVPEGLHSYMYPRTNAIREKNLVVLNLRCPNCLNPILCMYEYGDTLDTELLDVYPIINEQQLLVIKSKISLLCFL